MKNTLKLFLFMFVISSFALAGCARDTEQPAEDAAMEETPAMEEAPAMEEGEPMSEEVGIKVSLTIGEGNGDVAGN